MLDILISQHPRVEETCIATLNLKSAKNLEASWPTQEYIEIGFLDIVNLNKMLR